MFKITSTNCAREVKLVKKTIIMVLGCVFAMQVYGFVCASDNTDSAGKNLGQSIEKMHQKHIDKMAKDLSLTPEQKDKIAVILKEAREKKKAEMNQMHTNRQAEMDAVDKKITEVLTPEQAQKYEKMRADRKAEMEKKKKKWKHQDNETGN